MLQAITVQIASVGDPCSLDFADGEEGDREQGKGGMFCRMGNRDFCGCVFLRSKETNNFSSSLSPVNPSIITFSHFIFCFVVANKDVRLLKMHSERHGFWP